MRIISKFKDYYDGVQSYGQDSSLIYNRVRTVIPVKKDEAPMKDLFRFIDSTDYQVKKGIVRASQYFIGFCGKIYPCVRFTTISDNLFTTKVTFCFDAESVNITMEDLKLFKTIKEASTYRRIHWGYEASKSEQSLTEFFALAGEQHRKFIIDNKYLVFVFRECNNKSGRGYSREIVLNPKLAVYGLVKLIDPYSTFQELSMFLGGVLCNEAAPMIQIEDKYRIEGRGFDKWSFKNRG